MSAVHSRSRDVPAERKGERQRDAHTERGRERESGFAGIKSNRSRLPALSARKNIARPRRRVSRSKYSRGQGIFTAIESQELRYFRAEASRPRFRIAVARTPNTTKVDDRRKSAHPRRDASRSLSDSSVKMSGQRETERKASILPADT